MFDKTLFDLFGSCTNPIEYVTVFLFMDMLFESFFSLIGSVANAAGMGKR